MTFVVALREARWWKRLRPLWSPQKWGHKSSFVGLPNLGINPCLPCDCCYCVFSRLLVFVCLSLSNFILGFGLNLRFGGISVLREWPNIYIKPLGSGVVRLLFRKVKFSTAFVVHVGVGTSDGCVETSDDVGSFDPNCRDFRHWLTNLNLTFAVNF